MVCGTVYVACGEMGVNPRRVGTLLSPRDMARWTVGINFSTVGMLRWMFLERTPVVMLFVGWWGYSGRPYLAAYRSGCATC